MKRLLIGLVMLVSLSVLSGCSQTTNYLDRPETGRAFVGQPGRKYTFNRRGYTMRRNLVLMVADIDRLLMLDEPSRVYEDFVDY